MEGENVVPVNQQAPANQPAQQQQQPAANQNDIRPGRAIRLQKRENLQNQYLEKMEQLNNWNQNQ